MNPDDLSRLLLVLAPIEWVLTVFAFDLARKYHENSVWFLFGVFVMCALIVTVGAILGYAHLTEYRLPAGSLMVAWTVIFGVAAAVPPFWFVGYLLGKFR